MKYSQLLLALFLATTLSQAQDFNRSFFDRDWAEVSPCIATTDFGTYFIKNSPASSGNYQNSLLRLNDEGTALGRITLPSGAPQNLQFYDIHQYSDSSLIMFGRVGTRKAPPKDSAFFLMEVDSNLNMLRERYYSAAYVGIIRLVQLPHKELLLTTSHGFSYLDPQWDTIYTFSGLNDSAYAPIQNALYLENDSLLLFDADRELNIYDLSDQTFSGDSLSGSSGSLGLNLPVKFFHQSSGIFGVYDYNANRYTMHSTSDLSYQGSVSIASLLPFFNPGILQYDDGSLLLVNRAGKFAVIDVEKDSLETKTPLYSDPTAPNYNVEADFRKGIVALTIQPDDIVLNPSRQIHVEVLPYVKNNRQDPEGPLDLTIQNLNTKVLGNGAIFDSTGTGTTYRYEIEAQYDLEVKNNGYNILDSVTLLQYGDPGFFEGPLARPTFRGMGLNPGQDTTLSITDTLDMLTPTSTSGTFGLKIFGAVANGKIIQNYNIPAQSQVFIPQLNTPKLAYQETIKVYPNPATERVYIEVPRNDWEVQQIQLLNGSGDILLKTEPSKSNKHEIWVSELPPSVYFIKVQTNQGSRIKRIVKH